MLIPTIIMAAFALILAFLTYQKGGTPQLIMGLKGGGNILLHIAPLLIFAFIIAGMIPLLVPQEVISRWLGVESGFRGILIGTAMGSLVPGGPYVSLPIAAGLIRAGAGIGTIVSFVTGWGLIQITMLPVHIGIMGWKFTLIRLACTFFFPPIAGLIANLLFSRVSVI